jgi:Tol biopolymer transport system component
VRVEVSEGTELVAAVSPDGRRLALNFFGQLWIVPIEGGRAQPLTDVVADPRHDQNPSWSPDGTHLAFTMRGSPAGLRILELATGRIESLMTDRFDYESAWSPDGMTIAFASRRASPFAHRGTFGAPAVFLVELNTGAPPRRLTSDERRAGQPSFSPDGRSLLYAAPVSPYFYGTWPSWRTDLWELDLASGAERRLTSDSTLDGFPSYSPDGRWIAYISERSGQASVWAHPRSGGAPIELTPAVPDVHLARPSWLPDSRGVVFTAAGRASVAPLDRSGTRPIPFTATLRVARWRGLRSPEFPPPGADRVARGLSYPELSPDGRSVALAALGDLWVMDLTLREPRRLTRTSGDEQRPRWSPDGRRIAFIAGEQRDEVWVMENFLPKAGSPR